MLGRGIRSREGTAMIGSSPENHMGADAATGPVEAVTA